MTESILSDEKIASLVNKMPAFPRSVQQVLVLTSDINCSAKDLVKVIEHDPVLTGRILKVVNSAYFGLSRKMTSVKHAVVFVGINTIKHLALSIAAVGSLPRKNKAGLAFGKYLRHSLATGAIARQLAVETGLSGREAEDYFLAGLIHDIGKVVLSLHTGPEYRETLKLVEEQGKPHWQVEEAQLGISHPTISVMVCEKWQMPDVVCAAIGHHHQLPEGEDPTRLMACLFTANALADVLAGEKNIPPLPNILTTKFGFVLDEMHAQKDRFQIEIKKVGIFMNMS
jgi:HD-like signal output (HDOD) protein